MVQSNVFSTESMKYGTCRNPMPHFKANISVSNFDKQSLIVKSKTLILGRQGKECIHIYRHLLFSRFSNTFNTAISVCITKIKRLGLEIFS